MYKINDSFSITRIADGIIIPTDDKNTDYAAYLVWVAKGNTATPADTPTTEDTNQGT